MSTPPTGGIAFRVGPSRGSVGTTTTAHGNFLKFRLGYQLMGILNIKRSIANVSTGLRMVAMSPAVLGSRSAKPEPNHLGSSSVREEPLSA